MITIHRERLETGFYLIFGAMIIIGLGILCYGFISWMIYESGYIVIFSLLGGLTILMYIAGFLLEKIRKIGGPKDE